MGCALCGRVCPVDGLDFVDVGDGSLAVCVRCLGELDELADDHRDAWMVHLDSGEPEPPPLPWEAAWSPEHALVSEDRPLAARVA